MTQEEGYNTLTMNKQEIEMSDALSKVTELGIPTHSYMAAIQYLREHPLQTHTYAATYEAIAGSPLIYKTDGEARIRFNYLIQELLRLNGQPLASIVNVAQVNADQFIIKHPWSVKDYDIEDRQETTTPDDTTTEPVKSNGKRTKVAGRKEQAFSIYKANDGKSKAEILALFVAAGMSNAGAQTYFYQCKKELGFHGKSEGKRGKRGENKKAKALELYASLNDGRSQDAIIAEFENVLGTSHAGATTYFYACKAEHGFAGKSDSKRRGKKSTGGKTKVEIAVEVIKAHSDADKATLVGLIATACNTTPAGAQTFYYAAKRSVG